MYSINIRSKTSISGADIFTKVKLHEGNVESVWMLTPCRSDSENPAALYRRCSAAKPRFRWEVGCAHLATKNNRDTKPES